MADWFEFLRDVEFLDNSLWRWALAIGIAIGAFLVLRAAVALLRRRLRAAGEKTEMDVEKVLAVIVNRTKSLFLLVLALYAGSFALELGARSLAVVQAIVSISLVVQGALWATALLSLWIQDLVRKRVEVDAAGATSLTALGFLARVVLWAVACVLILHNAGLEVTTLIAGISVGGIAVALASQHILGDVFASIVILLDKPFVIGDFIILGDFMGTVEYVGLKTTRVRSLSGEQVVFSNTDLLNGRVRNFKRMYERRIIFRVGVTYQTPHETIAAIPAMLREIVQAQPDTRLDRAHFQSFGDFALVFETVYFVLSPDYARYMDIQQAINLEIHRRFEAEGIEFAYPTQTLYVHQVSVAEADAG